MNIIAVFSEMHEPGPYVIVPYVPLSTARVHVVTGVAVSSDFLHVW